MKLVLAAFVFFLTLGLTYKVSAETKKEAAPVECTADSKNSEECHQSKGESHGANHGEERKNQEAHGEAAGGHGGGGHHDGLSERMNSLFPPPVPDTKLGARPATTKTLSPKFLSAVSGTSVKLTWSAAAGATDYHVQVASDPNFKWLLAEEKFVKGTEYEFTKLEAGKRYYWRVASVKPDNQTTHTKSLFATSAFDVK